MGLAAPNEPETDVKWGMRQGAVDYLIKPYTQQQLLSLIARHV